MANHLSLRSPVLKLVWELELINTQFGIESEIQNGSKVFTFTRNHTKFPSFEANLSVKVKVTSLQTHLRHLDAQGQFKLEGEIQYG